MSSQPDRSSFAHSFFESEVAAAAAAENATITSGGCDAGSDNDEAVHSFPVSRSRPSHRASYHARRSGDSTSMGMAVAAAAASLDSNSQGGDSGDVVPDTRSSWYRDALHQQGGTEEKLKEILASDQSSEEGFGDDEVLEQYRIMAQHEARLRVKENIGFDIDEYDSKKLSTSSTTDKRSLYGGIKKPKVSPPEMRRLPPKKSAQLQTEEPPLIPPRPDPKLVQQKSKRVPELLPGSIVQGSSNSIPSGDHIVRCLGCRGNLRVNQKATLVSCPDCDVVSPASSTRR